MTCPSCKGSGYLVAFTVSWCATCQARGVVPVERPPRHVGYLRGFRHVYRYDRPRAAA